jgi:pyruvate dehydrogenase E2 component (dihydrolipoamide acetyltransferase)
MQKSLAMPRLGMTMTEGTVLQWLYKEGDFVEKDEALLEVMTDKVNIEVEAPFSGYLTKILAQEGDILPVGAPLATLVDNKEDLNPLSSKAEDVLSAPPVTITTVAIASTPAAKREAALQGVDLRAIVQAGAVPPLQRADVLTFVQKNNAARSIQQLPVQQDAQKAVRATPLAQKMAEKHQVDLGALAALKSGGKVTRADVEAHLSTQPSAGTAVSYPSEQTASGPTDTIQRSLRSGSISELNGSSALSRPLPSELLDGHNTSIPAEDHLGAQAVESELLPLSPVRLLIAQRMLNSFTSIPHIYLDTEIDMTEAERCRQRVGRDLQARGEKTPSLTAVLLRSLAASLLLYPQVNASFVTRGLQDKDAIRQWKVVHIGVAVDTGQALLTPVIRNAHLQSLPALSNELRRLSRAAYQGTLKPEDMAGATFTVSNLGMYGIDTFHAIIAPGQGAILAVGKVTKRGVVIEDEQGERLVIRPLMKVSLSADHRILDGAIGSRFLQQLKTFLEDPYLLV